MLLILPLSLSPGYKIKGKIVSWDQKFICVSLHHESVISVSGGAFSDCFTQEPEYSYRISQQVSAPHTHSAHILFLWFIQYRQKCTPPPHTHLLPPPAPPIRSRLLAAEECDHSVTAWETLLMPELTLWCGIKDPGAHSAAAAAPPRRDKKMCTCGVTDARRRGLKSRWELESKRGIVC